jgi:hypothetical protein
MEPTDLLKFTRKQPFEPFRLVVTDGTTYDITHPEFCMVAMTTVIVGIPGVTDKAPAADWVWVDPMHILKVIPLAQAATNASGGPHNNGTPG